MTARDRGRARRRLGDVLAAIDFSPGAAQALARAVRLPMRRGSTLTIFHVLPAGLEPKARARARTEAKEALAGAAAVVRAAARGGGVRLATQLGEGLPFVEIVRRARRSRADLVVLGRHGHRTFAELLLGSTAERVVRKGDTSVLVVAAKPAGGYVRPLVAVDLSAASGAAVKLSLRLTEAGARSIGVVHAYDTPPESTLRRALMTQTEIQRYERRARKTANAAAAGLLRGVLDAPMEPKIIVRRGDARRVILDVAGRRRPDLLALGSHGRTGLTYVLLGSVAASIVRAAPCDVLVVRAGGRRGKRFMIVRGRP